MGRILEFEIGSWIIITKLDFIHSNVSDKQEALKRFLNTSAWGNLAMSLQVMNPNLVEADWQIDSETVRSSDRANEKMITL